jgi:hypothetical protein
MWHSTLSQRNRRQVCRILGLWLWITVVGGGVWADDLPKAAPALPAGLSETERQTLLKETNPKDHLDTCLKVGFSRLATAAEAVKQERYEAAAQALRVYTSLLDYTHTYTRQTKEKVRQQMLRKLETTLRQHVPVLEWMLSSIPEWHEGCARQALNRAKSIRRESLNAYFGSEFLKAGDPTTE